jgi:hypothetical protein
MCYRCEACGKQSDYHQPMVKVVTKTRIKHYENDVREKGIVKSIGTEIVKEIKTCGCLI